MKVARILDLRAMTSLHQGEDQSIIVEERGKVLATLSSLRTSQPEIRFQELDRPGYIRHRQGEVVEFRERIPPTAFLPVLVLLASGLQQTLQRC
jgi:hypothetical protein